MITKVKLLGVGNSPVHCLDNFLAEHWLTANAKPLLPLNEYVETMHSLVVGDYRCEGYLYFGGEIAGFCFYSPAIDPHYGEVAVPVVDYIRPLYRNVRSVLKEFSELRRQVVGRLGARRFITVKHLNGTTQLQRLRVL